MRGNLHEGQPVPLRILFLGILVQAVADYQSAVVWPLVNRDTEQLLILIVCNVSLGYADGPDTGVDLRTPELSIRRCALCTYIVGLRCLSGLAALHAVLASARLVMLCCYTPLAHAAESCMQRGDYEGLMERHAA
jgi:hypothetical protein